MGRVRVLIADDSPTVREYLRLLLEQDPDLEVVGEARSGQEAIRLARELAPSVITMDIQMPGLDGLAATRAIMLEAPVPIVVISSLIDRGSVRVSMEALRAGAVAVLPKPDGIGSGAFEGMARRMVDTVKAMAEVKVVRRRHAGEARAAAPLARPVPETAGARRRGSIVAVAASTGGPAAIHELLSSLPDRFAAPILVVQHISQGFVEGFAVWLADTVALRVKMAEHGERLAAGTVYVAPDSLHLGVRERHLIDLDPGPPVGGFRPAATALFTSVARHYGAEAVAVVLTGMGVDGVQGLREVRRAGGTVLAQDQDTSVVHGMPGAALAAGVVDEVLPLPAMAGRLLEVVQ